MLRSTFLEAWSRARWARYAFVAGLVTGLGLGWAFHAVITFFFRFGLALVILIPLALIGYAVWRGRRGGDSVRGPGGMTIMRFGREGRGGGQPPWGGESAWGRDRPAPPWRRDAADPTHNQEGPIGR